jgi:hypothetical protein
MRTSTNKTDSAALHSLYAAFLGFCSLALIEGFTGPPSSNAKMIALYCFAIAIPCCVIGFSITHGNYEDVQNKPCLMKLSDIFATAFGLVLPIVGFTIWVWDLSMIAAIAFIVTSILLLPSLIGRLQ